MANIEIEGLEELQKEIEQVSKLDSLPPKFQKACALVEASAKEKAPKDTGALRRSITSKVETNGNTLEGTIFTALDYAPYVEYGTGLFAESGGRKTPWSYEDSKGNWHTTQGQHPHPFMKPAFEENKDKILQIIKEGVLIK